MVMPGGEREADGGPVRADFLGNRRDDFDGETGAVRDGAAIFIGARVSVWGEELLDEREPFRAVNLDTISAGLNGEARRKAGSRRRVRRTSSVVSARGAGMSCNLCLP